VDLEDAVVEDCYIWLKEGDKSYLSPDTRKEEGEESLAVELGCKVKREMDWDPCYFFQECGRGSVDCRLGDCGCPRGMLRRRRREEQEEDRKEREGRKGRDDPMREKSEREEEREERARLGPRESHSAGKRGRIGM